jgi:hypothetical protein
MKPSDERLKAHLATILAKLRAKKARGVTFEDFPKGFRLAGRIFDLREAGYQIATRKEPLSNGGQYARYVLLGGSRA